MGLLNERGTLKEVRVSDTDLVIRMLREQREESQAFRKEVRAEFEEVKSRLTTLEHTVSGMATHLFALTGMVKDHARRIRKLEARPK